MMWRGVVVVALLLGGFFAPSAGAAPVPGTVSIPRVVQQSAAPKLVVQAAKKKRRAQLTGTGVVRASGKVRVKVTSNAKRVKLYYRTAKGKKRAALIKIRKRKGAKTLRKGSKRIYAKALKTKKVRASLRVRVRPTLPQSAVRGSRGQVMTIPGDDIATGHLWPFGSKLAFDSERSDLVPGDTNNTTDTFVRDLDSGAITRMSTDSAGRQASGQSRAGSLSPDGSKLTFTSLAANVVAGDTNGVSDVFVKDLSTGNAVRVSTDASGGQMTGEGVQEGAWGSVWSPDGQRVAFVARGPLVPGDARPTTATSADEPDVYVKDLGSGVVIRASTNAAGANPADGPDAPAPYDDLYLPGGAMPFSSDGRKIAFVSQVKDLAPGGLVEVAPTSLEHLYVKDLQTGATTLIGDWSGGGYSVTGQPVSYSFAGFSPDDRLVAFHTNARGLSPDGDVVVGVQDLVTGARRVLSTPATGSQPAVPTFSPDGQTVVYASHTGLEGNLWAVNLADKSARRLFTGDFVSGRPSFSPDGAKVAFLAAISDVYQVLVTDLRTGTTVIASADTSGTPGNRDSGGRGDGPRFSGNGSRILFQSDATNLSAELRPLDVGMHFVKTLE